MLIQLELKTETESWQRDDIQRMKRILNAAGYDASEQLIQVAYESYSEDFYAAEWYSINGLPDEWVLGALMNYLHPVLPIASHTPDVGDWYEWKMSFKQGMSPLISTDVPVRAINAITRGASHVADGKRNPKEITGYYKQVIGYYTDGFLYQGKLVNSFDEWVGHILCGEMRLDNCYLIGKGYAEILYRELKKIYGEKA